MDPLSQAVLGSAFAQSRAEKQQLGQAAGVGAIAGMLPDLDILIRSSTDPLLALEYHRHFTHSLFFIPLGALLGAWLVYRLLGRRWELSWRATLTWSALGYGSHALLDACTSYGTQLMWPLSSQRFSWDIISVIDPLFTLPMLALVYLASTRKQHGYWLAALIWGASYLAIGVIQHDRAVAIGRELAAQRGHVVQRVEAKPAFGNLVLWKSVYETDARFYVDAVKPGWRTPTVWQGESIPRLALSRDLPWLDVNSQQARDVRRFEWFSSGYVALDPAHPNRVMDMRYSALPHEIKPLWVIELSPDAPADQHVKYVTLRDASGEVWRRLLAMIFH